MNFDQKLRSAKGPPKEVPASELLRLLMGTKRPSEVVPFPRNDEDGKPIAELRILVLTQSELDACCANAEVYASKLLRENTKREAWEEVYNNAKCVEVLFTACREIDDVTKHAFVAPSKIRELVTIDEAASLFHSYEAIQFRFGPLWRILTDEEINEWTDKLVDGVYAYPLARLPPGAVGQLACSLALRLRTWQTGIGSSGLPSDDTSTSISQKNENPSLGLENLES